VETDLECPSQEEIDVYIRKRDEYIAEQILKECGWDDFVKRCQLDNIEDFIAKHFPCEGPDGQCNMFCPQYSTKCWGILMVEGDKVSVRQKSVI
jgi:coenzyme F420-reducing hydrogenase gamma subunit